MNQVKKAARFLLWGVALVVIFHTVCWVGGRFQSCPDVTFVGKIKRADGIGGQIMDHQRILTNAGAKVNVRSTRFSMTGLSWKQAVNRLWQRVNRFPPMGRVVVYEGVMPPYSGKKPLTLKKIFRSPLWHFNRKNHILVAYSMFESSHIPETWVRTLNATFDAVAVPDPFLVDVYKNSGVRIPIFVVPLGVHYGALLNAPLKTTTNRPFVFSNLSAIIDRKNTLKTIQAFVRAFGNTPDVVFYLNGREYDEAHLKACQDFVHQAGVSNVHITTKTLSRGQFNSILKNSDCYVSLSKGEGFSIIPREAMALGVPVIVTDNTGQSTIARSGLVGSVPSLMEKPAKYFLGGRYFFKGVNYDFDIDDASRAMRDVFDHHQQYLGQALQARAWASGYSYTNKDLQGHYVRLFFRPEQCVLGDKDGVQPQGITFDQNNPASVNLYHKYKRLFPAKGR